MREVKQFWGEMAKGREDKQKSRQYMVPASSQTSETVQAPFETLYIRSSVDSTLIPVSLGFESKIRELKYLNRMIFEATKETTKRTL
jgi:hypothetical protein